MRIDLFVDAYAHLKHHFAIWRMAETKDARDRIIFLVLFHLISIDLTDLQVDFAQKHVGRIDASIVNVDAENVFAQIVDLKLHWRVPLGIYGFDCVRAKLLTAHYGLAKGIFSKMITQIIKWERVSIKFFLLILLRSRTSSSTRSWASMTSSRRRPIGFLCDNDESLKK